MNKFAHFSEKAIEETLGEIRGEIKHGYGYLVENICDQIKNYHQKLSKSGGDTPKLIVGLSGGIDSTVVCYLAVKAVGAKNIVAINLPAYEKDESVRKSDLVCRALCISCYTIPIESIVNAELEAVSTVESFAISPNTEMSRMRIGNYASRARVAVLYDIARKISGKVLGTGNRTEFVQGYAAKWGTPISFDFGILDDLYKVDIYELAKILGVPESIVEVPPSTGYYLGQTHEEELGATLEEQDVAAYLLFQKGLSKEEIVSQYGASSVFVDTMLERFNKSKEKRMIRQEHVAVRESLSGDLL